MRQSGTVKTIVEDRGFGFITPLAGGADIFLHAKACDEDVFENLVVGSEISFSVEVQDDGRSRAIDVRLGHE